MQDQDRIPASPRPSVACWSRVWAGCRRRIRRWRVPPHWSLSQWLEEIQAEGAAAALQATYDFDPARNVPLEAYVRMRVMGRAVARYRKEWGIALRQAPGEEVAELAASRQPEPQ